MTTISVDEDTCRRALLGLTRRHTHMEDATARRNLITCAVFFRDVSLWTLGAIEAWSNAAAKVRRSAVQISEGAARNFGMTVFRAAAQRLGKLSPTARGAAMASAVVSAHRTLAASLIGANRGGGETLHLDCLLALLAGKQARQGALTWFGAAVSSPTVPCTCCRPILNPLRLARPLGEDDPSSGTMEIVPVVDSVQRIVDLFGIGPVAVMLRLLLVGGLGVSAFRSGVVESSVVGIPIMAEDPVGEIVLGTETDEPSPPPTSAPDPPPSPPTDPPPPQDPPRPRPEVGPIPPGPLDPGAGRLPPGGGPPAGPGVPLDPGARLPGTSPDPSRPNPGGPRDPGGGPLPGRPVDPTAPRPLTPSQADLVETSVSVSNPLFSTVLSRMAPMTKCEVLVEGHTYTITSNHTIRGAFETDAAARAARVDRVVQVAMVSNNCAGH